MDYRLLTFAQGSELLGLASSDNFARFAKRHGIPIVRFGSRCVRIRSSDLERAIQRRIEPEPEADSNRHAGAS